MSSLLIALALTLASLAQDPAPRSHITAIEDTTFRHGLRVRGLTDWLQQEDIDHPPVDDADKRIREREALLAEAANPSLSGTLRAAMRKSASRVLEDLIDSCPDHQGRLWWQLELARDLLERREPEAFNALLLFELPGRDRARVHELSADAAAVLSSLRTEIDTAWQQAEALGEVELQRRTAAGRFRYLEVVDAQSVMLSVWARLYEALSAPEQDTQRTETLQVLLNEVTRKRGWTQLTAGQEVQRCHALIVATITARRAGDPQTADALARQFVSTFSRIELPADRRQLRLAGLLAVLEQIRAQRDLGHFDDALTGLDYAEKWVQQVLPDDIHGQLALAMLERSIIARKTRDNSTDTEQPTLTYLLSPPEAIQPIRDFAARSPIHRDALYTVLAGATGAPDGMNERSPFEIQLILGSAVMNAIGSDPSDVDVADRLNQAIPPARNVVGDLPPDETDMRGELLFLLGKARYLLGRDAEAVDALVELAEAMPHHTRAIPAAREASAVARRWLARTEDDEKRQALQAFVRAGQLLHRLAPNESDVRAMQYFIALALEHEGKLLEASEVYARVSDDDANADNAMFGRARCLFRAVDKQSKEKNADRKELEILATGALEAAREARTSLVTQAEGERTDCLGADVVVLLAAILNHDLINRSQECLETLDAFQPLLSKCDSAAVEGLRERVRAQTRLKHWTKALESVELYTNQDETNAGGVMAHVLEALRKQLNEALDAGDESATRALARDSARTTKSLLEWMDRHPDATETTDERTIRVWHAQALQYDGQIREALDIYNAIDEVMTHASDTEESITRASWSVEITLGRAECMIELDRADEALAIFNEIWQKTQEDSQPWWRAFVGSLRCHLELGTDPAQVRESIRQQKRLRPNLGGPRWKRALDQIESTNESRLTAADR